MKNLVVLSGAGMSAESGIATFRDADGLWEGHDVMEVATPEGFANNPKLVLDFYNQRRAQLKEVEPNQGHIQLKNLEKSNLALNLNINKPELIESNKIKIILSNSSQVELIEQEKINILTYLRNSLNNDLLELETQVKEIDKNDVPYTNSDKYKKMFEENENLAKLGARLGLDPDY